MHAFPLAPLPPSQEHRFSSHLRSSVSPGVLDGTSPSEHTVRCLHVSSDYQRSLSFAHEVHTSAPLLRHFVPVAALPPSHLHILATHWPVASLCWPSSQSAHFSSPWLGQSEPLAAVLPVLHLHCFKAHSRSRSVRTGAVFS